MDERFHRTLHLAALRRHDLVIGIGDRTYAFLAEQKINALAHDAGRLAHFFHTDQVTVIAVTVLTDRNIEFHFVVAFIRLRLAQIPCCTRTTNHDAREAPCPSIIKRNNTDIDVTLFKNAVWRNQIVEIGKRGIEERIDPLADIFHKLIRQILMNTTWTEISCVHTCTTSAFIEHHQLFTFFKAPERRRQRTNVHSLRGHVKNVIQNTADFRVKHADQLATLRHINAEQAFDSDRIGVLLIHRRHIIETVEIRQSLKIGLRFHQLLGAAMQQTDMRIDTFNDFAVEFKN